MTMTKLDHWPMVLPNDDGIRPAGPPDECFYCRSKVGDPHSRECAVVNMLVEVNVLIGDREVGTYQKYVPWHWTEQDIDFHFNESSWCSDNCLDEVKWSDGEPPEIAGIKDDECSCPLLRFELNEIVDQGPFVELR